MQIVLAINRDDNERGAANPQGVGDGERGLPVEIHIENGGVRRFAPQERERLLDRGGRTNNPGAFIFEDFRAVACEEKSSSMISTRHP